MRADFELALLFVGTLNRAHVPVVGCHPVRRGQRKHRLQISVFRLPIDHVAELDAIARVAGGKADSLGEL